MHTITGCAFYSWDAIALIGVLCSLAESGLLTVYTPTARLIDGRDVTLAPADCYRRAMAATIGAILDAQRRHHLEAAYKAGLGQAAFVVHAFATTPRSTKPATPLHQPTGGPNESP